MTFVIERPNVLDPGFWILDSGSRILDDGCLMPDAEGLMLDAIDGWSLLNDKDYGDMGNTCRECSNEDNSMRSLRGLALS